MKDFLKYLKENPRKLRVFLIPIVMLVLMYFYLFTDDEVNIYVKIGFGTSMVFILFILILQRWREYKGYEGLFGRN
jgi:putative effector of murein hydrolase LrgA (UPF0299 family)